MRKVSYPNCEPPNSGPDSGVVCLEDDMSEDPLDEVLAEPAAELEPDPQAGSVLLRLWRLLRDAIGYILSDEPLGD